MESEQPKLSGNEVRFLQLVSMFQMAALQQLGKLVDPATNEVERDLEQAKAAIDMIEMIKEKTKGNRSKTEDEYLEKILFELHMNYVDEVKKGGDDGQKTAEDAADKPEPDADTEKKDK